MHFLTFLPPPQKKILLLPPPIFMLVLPLYVDALTSATSQCKTSFIVTSIDAEKTHDAPSPPEADATAILHEDQLEVATPAVQGHNTLVIMPAGAGKTHVGASIIQEHINNAEDKDRCRVMFLVDKVSVFLKGTPDIYSPPFFFFLSSSNVISRRETMHAITFT